MNIFYRIFIILFLNGLTALAAQAVFFREAVNNTGAGAVMLPLSIAFWLLGAAVSAGFIFMKYFRKKDYAYLLYTLSFSPAALSFLLVAGVIAMRFFNAPAGCFACQTGLLFITAALSGAVSAVSFCSAAEILRREKAENMLKIPYIIEASGALVMGMVFTLFLSGRTPNLVFIYWIGIINLAALYILFREKTKQGKIILGVILAAIILYLMPMVTKNLDKVNEAGLKKGFEDYTVLHNEEHSAAKTTVAAAGENEKVYYVFSGGNKIYEYPSSQNRKLAERAGSGNVCVIGGGYTGLVNEILKNKNTKKITYIEPDEKKAEILADYFGEDIKDTKKVVFVHGDPVYYFMKYGGKEKFDAVVLGVPAPRTLAEARSFSYEFFSLLKTDMAENTEPVFILPPGYPEKAGSSVKGAVKSVFAGGAETKNTMLNPVAYSTVLKDKIAGSYSAMLWSAAVCLGVLLLFVFVGFSPAYKGIKAPYAAMFIVSFASVMPAYSLMFAFQSVYGFLYSHGPMFLGFFMLGIAAGGFVAVMTGNKINFGIILPAASIFNAVVLVYLFGFKGLDNAFNPNIVMFFLMLSGFPAGAAFTFMAGRLELPPLYGASAAGMSAGGILFVLVLTVFSSISAPVIAAIAALSLLLIPRKKR